MDIATFIGRQYEKDINEKMMYYSYEFPKEDVHKYIEYVCSIKIPDLIDYIIEMPSDAIQAKDVFQFSNIEDATVNICHELLAIDNPGLKHLAIGRILLNDGKQRKELAYNKYGENHAKTGESLGLLFELSKTYFLSCIGEEYTTLDSDMQERLLTRLILRNKLISRMIKATQNGDVNMRQFLYMLSDSTYKRRSSNIRTMMKILEESEEYDFSSITQHIRFD